MPSHLGEARHRINTVSSDNLSLAGCSSRVQRVWRGRAGPPPLCFVKEKREVNVMTFSPAQRRNPVSWRYSGCVNKSVSIALLICDRLSVGPPRVRLVYRKAVLP